ncbi:MAG: hypothetical protein ACRD5H_04855, partial [Nitrososphaerales archaeon]
MPSGSIYCEGYECPELSANDFGATLGGIWEAVVGSGNMSFVDGRLGGKAIRFASAAAETTLQHRLPSGNHYIVSGWFRMSASPAAGDHIITDLGQASTGISFRIDSTGTIFCRQGPAPPTGVEVTGPSGMADNNWHRLTYYLNTSANPWVVKWAVDGNVQTDNSRAVAAGSGEAQYRIGHYVAVSGVTFDWDDKIISTTPADYDDFLATPHRVLPLHVNGDGSHNFTPAGDFLRTATSMNPTDTNGWLEIDDWITGLAETSSYIADALGDSSEYTEFVFEDAAFDTIWFAQAQAAIFSADALANNAIARVVDSVGTTIADIYSGDMSEVTLHFRMAALANNPSRATLDGYKLRFGLATDVDPDPRLSAAMLQYAVPEIALPLPKIIRHGVGRRAG